MYGYLSFHPWQPHKLNHLEIEIKVVSLLTWVLGIKL